MCLGGELWQTTAGTATAASSTTAATISRADGTPGNFIWCRLNDLYHRHHTA